MWKQTERPRNGVYVSQILNWKSRVTKLEDNTLCLTSAMSPDCAFLSLITAEDPWVLMFEGPWVLMSPGPLVQCS